MLEERVNDRPFLRLIRKWLKAGILQDDEVILKPQKGTPQGGVVSPILANIYLHYVLDLWFEKRIQKHCKGAAFLLRYCDDFVCAFENRSEAEQVQEALKRRLKKFGLTLSGPKTRLLRFSRFGGKSNGRFDFLGFEFSWVKRRTGRMGVNRTTAKLRFQQALSKMREWVRKYRSLPLKWFLSRLAAKLRGHMNYFGVRCNFRCLNRFWYETKRYVFKWLNRRSQRKSYNWKGFLSMWATSIIPSPRIVEV
jgi:hypothetical protein